MALNRQMPRSSLICVKQVRESGCGGAKRRYPIGSLWGLTMKTLLHVKTALLIAYVALCTHLVLAACDADPAAGAAPAVVIE